MRQWARRSLPFLRDLAGCEGRKLILLIGLALAIVSASFCSQDSLSPPTADDNKALTGKALSHRALSHRALLFLGQDEVAVIEERWDEKARVLLRRSTLPNGDESEILLVLDQQGFTQRASYKRHGPRGHRTLLLEDQLLEDQPRVGKTLRSGGQTKVLSGAPILLLEALCVVNDRLNASTSANASTHDVEWVDLATGETMPGQVRIENGTRIALDAKGLEIARCLAGGIRQGPGAFLEAQSAAHAQGLEVPTAEVAPRLNLKPVPGSRIRLAGRNLPFASMALLGPGQRLDVTKSTKRQRMLILDESSRDTKPPSTEDREPALFMESDAAPVRAFVARVLGAEAIAKGKQPESAVANALQLAEAIDDLLDTGGGGGPPSAIQALRRKAGDCDDATALLVASLRAAGHAARPIVGYRAARGRWIPHAWAEVWNGEEWVPADAMVPGVGPFRSHLRLFLGLGSPFTLGRTLGALDITVLPPSP